MKYGFMLLGVLAAMVPSVAIAQDARLVDAGCRQGSCWETYWLGQHQIDQNQLGGTTQVLYEVSVENRSDYAGVEQYKEWVQCSTSEPFVAFEDRFSNSNVMHVHYINPGSDDVFGYNSGTHQVYWAVCHNHWDANVWNPSDGLAATAQELGYSLTLPTDSRTLPGVTFGQ